MRHFRWLALGPLAAAIVAYVLAAFVALSFRERGSRFMALGFVANGVEKDIYFSAAISADLTDSRHDIPELIHAADVWGQVSVLNLDAWHDDRPVIQAMKERSMRCLISMPAIAQHTRSQWFGHST